MATYKIERNDEGQERIVRVDSGMPETSWNCGRPMQKVLAELLERDTLSAAFAAVVDPDADQRGPIRGHCAPGMREIVTRAIEFFTATTPTFAPAHGEHTGLLEVRAAGHRAGPAGDH